MDAPTLTVFKVRSDEALGNSGGRCVLGVGSNGV